MLVLPTAVRDALLSHADSGGDEEICGVLAGDYGQERSCVEAAHPTANAAEKPRTRYRIDPEELLATIESVEQGGREVVGFYHSHPNGPAAPSATDAARATWTGYSYVICSLDGSPSIDSWRWTGEEFATEALVENAD
ncbi:MAG: desampylase [Halolamina sp.]|uniref:desampylase n=1 Tax=Halolamina sp. TaxID=1940283 RepID=UPI002FC33D5E